MKKIILLFIYFCIYKNTILSQASWTTSGCSDDSPIVQKIVIDACDGQEGPNEFIVVNTNNTMLSGMQISNMSISGGTPSAVSTNFNVNPLAVSYLNSLVGACSPPIFVNFNDPPYSGTIPKDATVIIFPQTGPPTFSANLSSLCGTGPYFVLNGNYSSTASFFANGLVGCVSNCSRTITVDINGCILNTTYDRTTFPLVDGASISFGGKITSGVSNCFPVVSCKKPTATATATPNSLCVGTSQNSQLAVTTNAPVGATYSWSGSSSFTSNLANPIIINNLPSGTYTYTVTVALPEGCSAKSSTAIVVNDLPNFTSIPDITICSNGSVPLSITGSPPPTNGAMYQWSGIGLSSSSSATPIITPPIQNLVAPFYTNNDYSVTVTEANGCKWEDKFVIQTRISPPVLNVVSPINSCLGKPIDLTATSGIFLTSSGANTITTFPETIEINWSGPNGYNNTSQVAAVPYTVTVPSNQMPAAAGTYIYSVTTKKIGYSHPTCISAPANVTVNIQAPSALTTTNKTVCQGQTIDMNSLVVAPLPLPAGVWSGAGVTTSPNMNTNSLAPGTYTITFTPTPSACALESTTTIDVIPPIAVSFSQTGYLCGNSAPYTGTVTLSATAGFANYQWSSGVIGNGNEVTVNTPGIYSVTVTNTTGCTEVKSFNIQSNPNPSVVITAPTALCDGISFTLTLNGSFNSYLWENGTTNPTLNITGSGVHSVTVTDANGCTATQSVNITSAPPLNPVIITQGAICNSSGSVKLSLNTAFDQYAWSNGLGTSPSVNVNNSGIYSVTVSNIVSGCTSTSSVSITDNVSPTVSVSGMNSYCAGTVNTITTTPTFSNYLWSNNSTLSSINANGTGTYSVTVTDINGCTAFGSKNVIEHSVPVPLISGSTSICSGGSTTLDAGSGYSSYLWSTGVTSRTVQISQVGLVSVTVTDINGCQGVGSVTISSGGSLSFSISGKPSFCAGSSTTLDAGVGFTSYVWSNGVTTPSITVNKAGTYQVTVSNGTCSGISSIVVTETPRPVFTITGKPVFCVGGSTSLTTSSSFTSYQWSIGGLNDKVTISSAGVVSVTVTDVNGCTGTQSLQVSSVPNPTPQIQGNLSICLGDSTQLSTTTLYTTYLWSNQSSASSIFAKANTTYSVTVSDANGCFGSNAVNIAQVNDLKPVIQGKKVLCSNDTIELTASAGFAQYRWSTGSTTPKIVVNQGGTYVVTVNNGACQGKDSITIVENARPTLVMSQDTTICSGEEATLKANGGNAIYAWSNGEKTPFITTKTSGKYEVTVTTSAGCSSVGTVELTVHPTPTPILIGPNTLCLGESATLKTSIPYSTYIWSNGSNLDSLTISTSGTYIVTVTNIYGCKASTSRIIQVKNGLTPQIIGKSIVCSGDSVILKLDEQYAQYRWSDGSTQPTLTVTKTGLYSVTVSSTSGCSGSTSSNVTVEALPTPNILGSRIICGSTPTVLDAGSGYSSYAWSNNATGQSTSISNAGTVSVTVTTSGGCKGTASITLTKVNVEGLYQDTLCEGEFRIINNRRYDASKPSGTEIFYQSAQGGCDSILNIRLYYRPSISITLSGLSTICSSQGVALTIGVSNYSGSFDMSYISSGSSIPVTLTNVKDGDQFIVTPTQTTTYTITNTSISNSVCPIQLGAHKIEYGSLTSTTKVTPISCYNKSNGGIAVFPQGVPPYTYVWSNNVTIGNNVDLGSGTYRLTISDAVGCIKVDSFTLTAPNPIVAHISTRNATCVGNDGKIQIDSLEGGSGNFEYSLDNISFNPIPTLPYTISKVIPTDYNVVIREAKDAGCGFTQSVIVKGAEALQVSLGPDITINYGDSVVITPTAGFQMTKIRWSPSLNLSCDSCQFPIAKPKFSTGYTVWVWDEQGCLTSDNILIYVTKPRRVYVPNIFSPNSDGNNDLLRIFLGEEVVKVNFFRLYDRWGNLVYADGTFNYLESLDSKRGWDGTYKGEEMNPAVFVYHAQVEFIDGEVKDLKGDVMLIR